MHIFWTDVLPSKEAVWSIWNFAELLENHNYGIISKSSGGPKKIGRGPKLSRGLEVADPCINTCSEIGRLKSIYL